VGDDKSLRIPVLILAFVVVGLLSIALMYSKRQPIPSSPKSDSSRNIAPSAGSSKEPDDRAMLEILAYQLRPNGTLLKSGAMRLVIGSRNYEAGSRFNVTYQGIDYELLLVSVDRDAFTLRYLNHECTRPIRLPGPEPVR
jgi:hypothetical protein